MVSLVSKIADFGDIMNAQLRLRSKARAPFSVRLRGHVQLSGCGEVVLGEGVSLSGTVVPIELVTYTSGRIEIGSRTFVNYGSSIAARTSVKIGSYCFLGHYTFVMDNHQHDLVRHTKLPQSEPVIIEDHVWIGSKAPARNWCGQHRYQGHSSAMCGCRESCACATSAHGARLSHAGLFTTDCTSWAER
jgi:carbonic anhydrase/acetyltransferase-like protein (isoleucine patch superfamily)